MDYREPVPEREPLMFEFAADNVTPDITEVRIAIKQAAERLLYHWKTFPIVLPASITEVHRSNGHGDEVNINSFKDLFIAPTFDELDQVARDAKGNPRQLNQKQLRSIQLNGEFDVESINFPGQVHRWRLSQLLQKGSQRSRETMLNDMAFALRLILIHARNRFASPFLSVSEGLRSIGRACWQLLDIIIGMPATSTRDLESKLAIEHSRFLVAELNIRPDSKRDWKNFCDYIKDKCSQLEMEKSKTMNFTPPPVPYWFQTPKGSDIDLRLLNRDLMNQCVTVLKKILEQESRGWYIKYKDRLITDLKGQNMTYSEIKEYVNKSIQEKYVQQVFEAVLHSADIENLQSQLGALLVQQAKCALSMEKAVADLKDKLAHHQQEHKQLLIKSFPVRSRIPQWLDEQLQDFLKDFVAQHQWTAHQRALDDCRQQGLDQMVYFLYRDLIYVRDREPILLKELSRVKHPDRVFHYHCHIWFPHRWVVTRQLYGESEVIPTVITDTPASGSDATHITGPDEPTYTVEKYVVHKTSTRLPFWRWINFLTRTWTWTWNAMFFFGVVIPWCCPLSFRALFLSKPFMANLQLNPVNGSLCLDPSSRTNTLMSRLRALWRHVHRSRAQFENEPETGLLGKSFTRHLNRAWNYVIKGAVGSAAIVAAMVPSCLLISLSSLLIAFTAPFWVPILSLITHLGAVVIYDFNHPNGRRILYAIEVVVFRLFIAGFIQPLCAVLLATIVFPFAALVVSSFALLRRGLRVVYDRIFFHAVIKSRGHIPSQDGFTVRRIAGPGLASSYYYQIRPEQALAAAEARMELHELNVWKDNLLNLIEKPKEDFKKFAGQCFSPFSAGLFEEGVYKALCWESTRYAQAVNMAVEQRKQKLQSGLSSDIQCRIRLTSRELKVVIAQLSKLLENFYPEHVLQRLPRQEAEFWEDCHLEPGDWQGLATQLLTEVFSSSFLTPLEETDTCFQLEVRHLNLLRYLEMLKSAEFRDDLDVVSTVHTPKGDIDVEAPYLDVRIFSARAESASYVADTTRHGRHRWRGLPWKRQLELTVPFDKLQIPLPVAHPVVIAVLIHNRDVDGEPINLDDDLCEQILRTAELLNYVELCDGAASVIGAGTSSQNDVDVDSSSPDHMTSNSDPDVVQVHIASERDRDRTLYENTPSHGVAVAAVAMTSPNDVMHAAGTAELRVVYLATTADTSCVTVEDETNHQHIALDVDTTDSYSNAATLLRE